MKLFMASLATESNSFSPIPTGWSGFREHLYTKTASRGGAGLFANALVVWRDRAEERGWNIVESLSTFAQPAGPTTREVYEAMRDDILSDLQGTMPVDIVLLSMHGAMIAQGYDDCEGDLLVRIREIVGADAKIGLELDPHCHLTEAMIDNTTAIICYKEYPHTDVLERAEELFTICADAATGKTQPVMRDYDCRMIAMYHTPSEPVRGFIDRLSAIEGREGILSISLVHGFPWGDNARCGTRILVIADRDAELASTRAQTLGQELWELRGSLRRFLTIDEGIDHATAEGGPVVLADFADNAGGGAPSDSTFVLHAALQRNIKDIAFATFWDPVLVGMCIDAGLGAEMSVRVGGKIGRMSGDPVDLDVVVRGIACDAVQHLGSAEMSMGDCVWLEANGVHIVVNTKRTQTFHPEAFENLGMVLNEMKYIVVKSSQHFYDGFAHIAKKIIYLGTPGAITPEFAKIPFKKRSGNYWPRIENPFA